ncbi:hypothetical protein JCM10450v2_001819 [Rhodotorula kratochvilovae]
MTIALPHPLDIAFSRRSSEASTSTAQSEPSSPYLCGSPLSRVPTRTSSMSSATTLPSDDVDAQDKHELSTFATRYSLGSPLSRVRTRTDSSCLWEHLPPALSRSATPAPVLYQDSFVTLTSSTLTISHLLFRRAVTLPLSRIHAARAFCSPAQLVKLAASPSPSSSRRSPRALRPPRGVCASGLSCTGVLWARDPARLANERWRERAVVVEAEGWLARVGFSVEDPGAWWDAWEQATGVARC